MPAPCPSHGRLAISASAKPREVMSDTPRLKGAWCAKVVTLFPELFPGVLGASLTGKALQRGLWALEPIDLRIFGTGKHRQVDDTPAGGGAGLVMKPDVLGRALSMAATARPTIPPAGRASTCRRAANPLRRPMPSALPQAEGMTLLCGRFEGVDQRVIEAFRARGGQPWRFRPDRRRDRGAGGDRRHRPPDPRRPGQCRLDRGGKLFRRAFWNIPNTPSPAAGRAATSPMCCSRATTAKSPNGAARRPSA
jgi:hypothetical protein